MYGDAQGSDYVRITSGDRAAFEQAVRQWGIRWAILPRRSRLIWLLDHSPGWRRVAADDAGVVYLRSAA
jgi:hypothetical protein